MSADAHHETNYVKIYFILLGLLIVSIVGPELGIRPVTLFTAFGVAIIKAYFVVRHFMHIDLSPRYVTYLCATTLVFMLLFFAGTAPDVLNAEGDNWRKPQWQEDAAAWARGERPDTGAAHH